MRTSDLDLLAGALTMAYKYADLPALRQAYAHLESNTEGDLPAALEELGQVSHLRADKLRQGSRMLHAVRMDAVYGMIALRNNVIGAEMLNACMEEARRSGYGKSLGDVLREKGFVSEEQDESIAARRDEVLAELLSREQELAAIVDLQRDPPQTGELKLGMLLGEVASKVSFLPRTDLESMLQATSTVSHASTRIDTREVVNTGQIPQPEQARALEKSAENQEPIRGYELLLMLGQGAMGAVLKARRHEDGAIVALKVLRPELACDPEYVGRFQREAKAVQRLNHPNIIRAIEYGQSGEHHFFAMEFVEGQSASELIRAKGRLPESFALKVVRCVASALAHATRHGIVHRDIKPDNVMITTEGEVKLTDLGLARSSQQDSTLTITGVVVGSPAYISPEQATGQKNLDTRSDIYSLGATLYHMVSGKVPYDGETPLHVMLRHMNDPVPNVHQVAPDVTEATRLLIMKMMAKAPQDRFSEAREVERVARDIEEALCAGRTPPLSTIATRQPSPSAGMEPVIPHRPTRRRARLSEPGKTAGEPTTREKELGERVRRIASKRKRRFR